MQVHISPFTDDAYCPLKIVLKLYIFPPDASSSSILSRNSMDDTLWNKCGQQYFERLSKLNQASLLDIGLFDETIEIIRSFMTEVCVVCLLFMFQAYSYYVHY